MRQRSLYQTSAVIGGSGAPGSIQSPYTVTGASEAAVLTALAGLTATDGAYATATVTGSAPRLMQYVAADSAWYATDGGDGTQLAPFWTTSTGEDGIDALPAADADAYGVIGKGTGSPQSLRRLTLIADGTLSTPASASSVGCLLPGPVREWVSPTLHALGTPATCYIMDRSASTAIWSATAPSGSQFNWNSTVANRVSVRSGTAATQSVFIGTRSTSSRVGFIARRLGFTGAAVAGSSSFLRTISSSDSGQFSGLAAGGSTATGATTYQTWGPSATFVDTGIAISGDKSVELLLNMSTNGIEIRVNGASSATYTGTSVATTASTEGAQIAAGVQSAQTTVQFRTFYAMEW